MDSRLTDEGDRSPVEALDQLKRDRFELLSAYLDGEVTAAERHQVEDWLKTDPTVQQLYARLLRLRQGVRSLPIPPSPQPVEETVTQVLTRIDRRPKRMIAWGGATIAAAFVGAVASFLPTSQTTVHQVAIEPVQPPQSQPAPEALMIALDRPIVEIPKAPVSTPYHPTSASYESNPLQ